MGERIVVAIGGNSIVPDPARATFADQLEAIRETARSLVTLRQAGHELILTHGNGPQVGFGLRASELAQGAVPARTLDSIDADTQGSLGYLIQQALGNALAEAGLDARVVSVVTQVVVDAQDPAFHWPEKPVGGYYTEAEAQGHIRERRWNMVYQAPHGWRRVVPSPRPLRIVESWAIEALAATGAIVVGCGGGGIPVVEGPHGLEGRAAVIDKDRASALLAQSIGARTLMFSTGVSALRLDFGKPLERVLSHVSAEEAQRYLDSGEFPPGSMGPKVEGSIAFLRGGGRQAIITAPECLAEAYAGQAGTWILPGDRR